MIIFSVKRKDSGKVYDCFAQMVDLNFNGRYVLRYNIGRNTYHDGFINEFCVYDNDEFNEKYEVVGSQIING